jgi:hypothetical protein
MLDEMGSRKGNYGCIAGEVECMKMVKEQNKFKSIKYLLNIIYTVTTNALGHS